VTSAIGAVGNSGDNEGGLVVEFWFFTGEREIKFLVFVCYKDKWAEGCFTLAGQLRVQGVGSRGWDGKVIAAFGIGFRGERLIANF